MRFVLIGAGLCGLTAAYNLLLEGHEVAIYEKKDYIGGMAASKEYKGYNYDQGVHIFHMMDEYASDLIYNLLENNLYTREFCAKTFIDGIFYEYPPSVEKVMELPPELKNKILSKMPQNYQQGNQKESNNFEDWLAERMGRPFFEHYFEGYTTKWWGIAPKKISADLIKSAYESLFKHSRVIKSYPKLGGIGKFPQKFGDLVKKTGGNIFLEKELVGVEIDGNKISKLRFKTKKGIEYITDFDFVISTASLEDLCSWLGIDFLDSLSYRSMIILLVILKKSSILDVDWIHFAPKDMIISRVYEPKRFSKNVVPKGRSSLVVEIPCELRDNIWKTQDTLIFEKAVYDLERTGLIAKDEVLGYDITRLKQSHPIYSIDYKKELQKVQDELSSFINLITTGRLGGFRYTTMDSSIRMGLEAAREAIKRVNSMGEAEV
jgi:protoporphyrinogen oxidase